jgi:hypothetical protein
MDPISAILAVAQIATAAASQKPTKSGTGAQPQPQSQPYEMGLERLRTLGSRAGTNSALLDLLGAGGIASFAHGGASRGGPALVGEEGPELVDLPPGAVVHPFERILAQLQGESSFEPPQFPQMRGGAPYGPPDSNEGGYRPTLGASPQVPEPAPQFGEPSFGEPSFGDTLLNALGNAASGLQVNFGRGAKGTDVIGILAALAGASALTAPARRRVQGVSATNAALRARYADKEARRGELEDYEAKQQIEARYRKPEKAAKAEPFDLATPAGQAAKIDYEKRLSEATRAPAKPDKPGPNFDPGAMTSLNTAIRSDPDIKNFVDVRSGYDRVRTGSKQRTPQGDIAVVFGYMKMLDPGSTVREGEYATAENSAGIPQRIAQQYNRVLRGDRLSDEQRRGFDAAARKLYESGLPSYRRAHDLYGKQADALKVPRDLVLRDYSALPDSALAPQRPPLESYVRP